MAMKQLRLASHSTGLWSNPVITVWTIMLLEVINKLIYEMCGSIGMYFLTHTIHTHMQLYFSECTHCLTLAACLLHSHHATH